MKKLLVFVLCVCSVGYALADVTVSKCVIQVAKAGAQSKAYVNIDSTQDDVLKSVNSDIATAGLYSIDIENGARTSHAISSFPIVSGSNPLSIGGTYIGLDNLKVDLVSGQHYNLTLVFEKAGNISCDARVRKAGAILKDKYRATPLPKKEDDSGSIISNIFNYIF